jgi:predicted peptidase
MAAQTIGSMHICNLLLATSLLLIPACSTMHHQNASSGETAAHFDGVIKVSFDYLVHLPPEMKKQKEWPAIIFLHGSGERGTNVWQVAKHGPPNVVKTNNDFPFIVISPQCPPEHRWQADEVIAFVKSMEQQYPIDADRVYLTGLSMGGFGTWSTLMAEPDMFAAAVPICGGAETNELTRLPKKKLEQVRHLPIWVFHGAKDPTVPVKYSEEMVAALKKINADVKLTIYPDALHDSWTQTYANPELYDWLLAQNRKNNERAGK